MIFFKPAFTDLQRQMEEKYENVNTLKCTKKRTKTPTTFLSRYGATG
jgi:hypothetical protein